MDAITSPRTALTTARRWVAHGPQTKTPWRIGFAIDALAAFWKECTVADITKQTCQRYVTTRSRSNGTTRRELGVLRAGINHAHREGRLTRSVPVSLPDSPEPRERWLTRIEAARLLRSALREPRVRLYLPLFILLGLYTCRRKEAILSLRWAQVDLEAGQIDFRTPGAPMTNKRRGRIPIPRKLLPHLRQARLRGTEMGFVIHDNGARLVVRAVPVGGADPGHGSGSSLSARPPANSLLAR